MNGAPVSSTGCSRFDSSRGAPKPSLTCTISAQDRFRAKGGIASGAGHGGCCGARQGRDRRTTCRPRFRSHAATRRAPRRPHRPRKRRDNVHRPQNVGPDLRAAPLPKPPGDAPRRDPGCRGGNEQRLQVRAGASETLAASERAIGFALRVYDLDSFVSVRDTVRAGEPLVEASITREVIAAFSVSE